MDHLIKGSSGVKENFDLTLKLNMRSINFLPKLYLIVILTGIKNIISTSELIDVKCDK
jgi:hypothetical protein